MVGFTYPQKGEIIKYLSEKTNWENRFDMAFFSDETRRWKPTSSRGVYKLINPDQSKGILAHEQNGVFIKYERKGDNTLLEDESGRKIVCNQTISEGVQDSSFTTLPILTVSELGLKDPSTSVAEIPGADIFVRFHADKTKTIFLEKIGRKIQIAEPTAKIEKKSTAGRYFHTIKFNRASSLPHLKLVLARDLCLQPDLRAVNVDDPEKGHLWIQAILNNAFEEEDRNEWQSELTEWDKMEAHDRLFPKSIEKDWHDTTEFEGFATDLSKQFCVALTDTDFEISTSLDNREAIWSQGAVYSISLAKRKNIIARTMDDVQTDNIVSLLQNGADFEDHRSRLWKYALIENPEAPILTNHMRKALRGNFGLSAHDCAVMTVDKNLCLIAMSHDSLAYIALAHAASLHLMDMIQNRSSDTKLMLDLLRQGADLKYLDFENSRNGHSFANYMRDFDCYELLGAMRSEWGVHDLRKPQL